MGDGGGSGGGTGGAPSAVAGPANDLRTTTMVDMLSQPLPQPSVSGARHALHMASQMARGCIPPRNRSRTKSTACETAPSERLHSGFRDRDT